MSTDAEATGSSHPVGNEPELYDLRLYVAGQTPVSIRAMDNLRRVCDEHLKGRHQVEVIDILVHPALARRDEIVAVPTLVRRLPAPIRKIVGDLSDTDQVLVGLQVLPHGENAS